MRMDLPPRPWVRSYQYLPAALVRLIEGLDWGDL